MFRYSLIVSSLFFSLIASAAVEKSVEIKVEQVSGRDVATLFSLQCSKPTWDRFASWANTFNFVNQKIKAPYSKLRVVNGAFVAEGFRMTASKNSIQAEILGQKYTGTDICDLFMKTTKVKTSALQSHFFFEKAWAEDLVSESRTFDHIAYSVEALMCAGGLVGMPFTMGTSAFLCVAGAGGGVFTLISETTKSRFEGVLNHPFALHCDEGSLAVTAGDKKIVVDKSVAPYEITMSQIKNKKWEALTVHNDITEVEKSADLLRTWATSCHNQTDADNFVAKANSYRGMSRDRMLSLASIETGEAKKDSGNAPTSR